MATLNQAGTNNHNWRGGKSTFRCIECGKEFKDYHRKRADRKFCSIECGYKNKERRVSTKCEHCGVEFEVFIYNLNRGRGKFCSKSCARLAVADEVSKRFKDKPKSLTQRKRMSESLRKSPAFKQYVEEKLVGQTGEKNRNWKGGITPPELKIRGSEEYKGWRTKVFKRDDYTCQLCGIRGGVLNAHHVLSFVDFPKYRFEVDNGITYCKECHEILTGILMTGDIFQPLPQLNV